MIAPLRRRHRTLFAVLTLTVPVVCALAIRNRPQSLEASPDLRPAIIPQASDNTQSFNVLAGVATRVHGDPGTAWLEIEPAEPLRQPDVLAYFSISEPTDSLPVDAHLLGAVSHQQPRSFALPTPASEGGHLILYSLAHQSVVQTGRLPPITFAAKSTSLPDETTPLDTLDHTAAADPSSSSQDSEESGGA